MKKAVFLLAAVILFGNINSVKSQEEDTEYRTLFKQNGKTSVSGFGGLIMEFSSVDNQFAYSMGGQGAALFNQSFFIGLYGQGLVNLPKYTFSEIPISTSYEDKSIMFFHGGFYTGFVFTPNNPFHFGVSSKFGWGGITLFDDIYGHSSYPPGGYYPYPEYAVDMVFVITPQVEAEMNITNWFKVNLGFGYRFVTGVDATYEAYDGNGGINDVPFFDSDAFNNMTFVLGLNFGWFK